MRRMFLTLSTAVALVALAAPVDAQLKFGVQGAMISSVADLSAVDVTQPDLSGTFGAGLRAALQPPIFPLGVVAQGVYYMPDLDDTGLATYSLAAQLRVPLPLISPYVIGGMQWTRRAAAGAASTTSSGLMAGVGVQLTLGLFLEATMELPEDLAGAALSVLDNDPIVIKAGFVFGG
ncbi:MAG TPA: hypothetical protein EYQ64_07340 [Gemmatimonadetes bacterium]|nr:hypothetical protein [Gemmatimonadota bacterium]